MCTLRSCHCRLNCTAKENTGLSKHHLVASRIASGCTMLAYLSLIGSFILWDRRWLAESAFDRVHLRLCCSEWVFSGFLGSCGVCAAVATERACAPESVHAAQLHVRRQSVPHVVRVGFVKRKTMIKTPNGLDFKVVLKHEWLNFSSGNHSGRTTGVCHGDIFVPRSIEVPFAYLCVDGARFLRL